MLITMFHSMTLQFNKFFKKYGHVPSKPLVTSHYNSLFCIKFLKTEQTWLTYLNIDGGR